MSRTLLLWFGASAAPLAWAVHNVVGYGYEEFACSPGTIGDGIRGLGVEPFIAILTVAMAGVALAGGAAGWVTWKAAQRGDVEDPRGRISFTGFASVVSSALFLAIIVMGGIQIVGLTECAP